MKNIYFMELNGTPYFNFLPYVYGILRVAAEQDPRVAAAYRFNEPCFVMWNPEKVVAKLQSPAVLALSCYVWNFRRHMKIARLCKQRFPETLVIAGGPHIPIRVGNFFDQHPYVDVLIHGEGELAFQRVLRANLDPARDFSAIPGVTFRRDGHIHTTPRERLVLEGMKDSPYLLGYLDRSIALCKALKLDFYALWETNRGCPYSCSFCDWGSNTMSKIRTFELERLMQEIEFFAQREIPNVHINDANFGILPRDMAIAQRLVDVRSRHGFPISVVTNWAKNSNDRVFEISRMWNDRGMFRRQGLTLSMQATDPVVLDTIKRKNIGVERYKELQQRYAKAHIHTYTEIILGLPSETRDSFKRGLDPLLALEKHDDIRIYDCAILPNAPIADPESMQKHAIKTIDKHMTSVDATIPEDEIELIPTVIETSSLSQADWVECAVYAQILKFMHNGCYARYLSQHLQRAYDYPFHRFYGGLQQHFMSRESSLTGMLLNQLHDYYQRYQRQPSIPKLALDRSPPEALALLRHMPAAAIRPADWAWICLASRQSAFYHELAEYLATLQIPIGEELADLLRFQRDVMLTPDYDPRQGKARWYAYDFPSYFAGDGPLQRQATYVRFCDTHMGGSNQYPLESDNPAKFVLAAIGGVSGHFQHQLSVAEIRHADPNLPLEVSRGESP